jgi:hypothetical protein
MKTFLGITGALVLGAVVGVVGAHLYDASELYEAHIASIQQTGQQSVAMASFDVALFEEIEAGHQEQIKSLLARQVASFYQTFHDFQPMSAETRKLMNHIQQVAEKSPSLKEALNAPPK